jgi:hypothetical protein
MPASRRNSLGRNHNKLGRFTTRAARKASSQTRKSHNHAKTVGSRAEVMHGTAHHTSGGLAKTDLLFNKHGRIVSRKKHSMGKSSLKHLTNAGYIAKKGEFVAMQKH